MRTEITVLDEVKAARPILRSVVALAIYLRFGGIRSHYDEADEFLDRLEQDISDAENAEKAG